MPEGRASNQAGSRDPFGPRSKVSTQSLLVAGCRSPVGKPAPAQSCKIGLGCCDVHETPDQEAH